jgi:hypothetical protein
MVTRPQGDCQMARPGSVGAAVLFLNTVVAGVAGLYGTCRSVAVTLAGVRLAVALTAWYLWIARLRQRARTQRSRPVQQENTATRLYKRDLRELPGTSILSVTCADRGKRGGDTFLRTR